MCRGCARDVQVVCRGCAGDVQVVCRGCAGDVQVYGCLADRYIYSIRRSPSGALRPRASHFIPDMYRYLPCFK